MTLAIAFASPSYAASHDSFNKDELKCRKGLAKTFLKTISTGNKLVAGCHKLRNLGKLDESIDCNSLTTLGADSKGKFRKAADKIAAIAESCDLTETGELLEEFVSCPEPCSSALALPNPLQNLDQVAECMSCYAETAVGNFATSTIGTPLPTPLGKRSAKCHGALAKKYPRYIDTILKERTKCQDAADKLGFEISSSCEDDDPTGKIEATRSKATKAIEKACEDADLTNLGACATTTGAALAACAEASSEATADTLFPLHYAMPATVCPVSISTTIRAGTPEFGLPTATRLDTGWGGIGHGQDFVDGYTFTTAVTCPNSSAPCGDCAIDGIADDGIPFAAYTRCQEDTSIPCTTPFSTDAACPGLQKCGYYLGPPLPASASNTPVCILNRLTNDVSGTANPQTGDASLTVSLRSQVFNGISLTQPCPRCVGDTTPLDGVRAGLCQGGQRDQQPCDVQGFDATFAPGSGVSLDCSLSLTSNVTGEGLQLALGLTTGQSTLPFGTQCDFPLDVLDCACAVCSADVSVPCNSDLDCAMIGAGTCTSIGTGEIRRPNSCGDGYCMADSDGIGFCPAGPDVRACDGQVRANNEGYILCATNGDCGIVDSACGDGSPGSCGNCTLVQQRSCFDDPIVATGIPDPDGPLLAGTFCVPATSSNGVNSATGLPGPSRALVQTEWQANY